MCEKSLSFHCKLICEDDPALASVVNRELTLILLHCTWAVSHGLRDIFKEPVSRDRKI
jgi:hypothetical protein